MDEWAAEGGVAPPIPPGTTPLLDDVLHVEMHAFCHKFLADGVCTLPLCLGPVSHAWCTSQQCCICLVLVLPACRGGGGGVQGDGTLNVHVEAVGNHGTRMVSCHKNSHPTL